jgi:exopolyphosphatase/guanosine-5'-triphosphate,3'-diphosphate pyrophosphatase
LVNKRLRSFVEQIFPLLRLAVALDRRQISAVASVKLSCQLKNKQCKLEITPAQTGDQCALELWSLDYKKTAFENQYQMSLTVLCAQPTLTIK